MVRTRWKVLGAAAALSVAAVAVIGVAHTPMGRPLLAYIPGFSSVCPIGAELDPVQRAQARAEATRGLRTDTPAPSHRVLAFELGQTSKDDVRGWARDAGLRCEEALRWTCSGHRLEGLEATVSFGFDPQGRLLEVEQRARVSDAADASAATVALARHVESNVGPATLERGRMDAGYLAAAPLRQHLREFRFADLRARVSTTNLGERGFAVRSVHQAL